MEWIAITMQDQHNVNQASWILNLCTSPSSLFQEVEEIFELYDETHPEKAELSQKRRDYYKSKDLLIHTLC